MTVVGLVHDLIVNRPDRWSAKANRREYEPCSERDAQQVGVGADRVPACRHAQNGVDLHTEVLEEKHSIAPS